MSYIERTEQHINNILMSHSDESSIDKHPIPSPHNFISLEVIQLLQDDDKPTLMQDIVKINLLNLFSSSIDRNNTISFTVNDKSVPPGDSIFTEDKLGFFPSSFLESPSNLSIIILLIDVSKEIMNITFNKIVNESVDMITD
ncbi:hypothetical protein C1645_816018 [Glomus cerebriforme]|uniref:Uncharacterized protein n=1 Tax=Glomus cerebriforme TaxID=658196 RepID=A0A397THR0_9GLOM|nr:hypothetical protein C1645_816018 [Glomus cerebriforme]